ncbi:MAG TPA: response regulator, partial [Candidatus Binataceae bacterium]|nr:response regulator [Candidatus Binataceae bacterium]
NVELLSRALESHLNASEMAVETQHLNAIREGVSRVSGILRRLDQMSRKGVYQTRDYMSGKRMVDLAAPETSNGQKHEAAKPAEPAPAHPSPESWPLAGMSILVLDDDVSVVTSLADLLRCERCIVHTATRPSAALGILRNMKVDAVISDVVMPEMDGYEFYLKVKEEMPGLPVILMTAYYYDKDHIIKRSRLKGLEGALFKKPVNPGKLRQMLSQLRHKPPQVSRTEPAPA